MRSRRPLRDRSAASQIFFFIGGPVPDLAGDAEAGEDQLTLQGETLGAAQ